MQPSVALHRKCFRTSTRGCSRYISLITLRYFTILIYSTILTRPPLHERASPSCTLRFRTHSPCYTFSIPVFTSEPLFAPANQSRSLLSSTAQLDLRPRHHHRRLRGREDDAGGDGCRLAWGELRGKPTSCCWPSCWSPSSLPEPTLPHRRRGALGANVAGEQRGATSCADLRPATLRNRKASRWLVSRAVGSRLGVRINHSLSAVKTLRNQFRENQRFQRGVRCVSQCPSADLSAHSHFFSESTHLLSPATVQWVSQLSCLDIGCCADIYVPLAETLG